MAEIIVNMKSDYIKVKGGEYKQDLIRCKDCKYLIVHSGEQNECKISGLIVYEDDYCSYAEERS